MFWLARKFIRVQWRHASRMLNSTVHNKLYGQFGFRILFHERTDCCSWLHAQGVIVVKTGIQCFFSGGWNPTVFFFIAKDADWNPMLGVVYLLLWSLTK